MAKYTTEEFKRRADIAHPNNRFDYSKTICLSAYSKVEIICSEHGSFWQRSSHHLEGRGCPKCSHNVKLTNADVDTRLIGKGIARLSDFVTVKNKILVKGMAADCGHEWMVCPTNLFAGSGCPICSRLKSRITNSEVDFKLVGKGIIRVSDVVGSHKKAKFKCDYGHEWLAIVSNVIRGATCPKCANRARLNNSEVDERLRGRNILRLGEVKSGKDKVRFKCLNYQCGNEWEAIPGSVLNVKSGCPSCASHGFDGSKPSVLYVYLIGETFCGYGITNDFKVRHAKHSTEFLKAGVVGEIVATYNLEGVTARRIERLLQTTFEVVNTGIPGFKTEATDFKNIGKVLELISMSMRGV